MKQKRKKTSITVLATPDEHSEWKEISSEMGLGISDFIRLCVHKTVSNNQRSIPALLNCDKS